MKFTTAVVPFLVIATLALIGLAGAPAEACCVFGNPPTINAIVADPGELWPPNHKMVDVVVFVDGDPGTLPTTWVVSSVEVLDVDGGAGDPLNDPDWATSGMPVAFSDPQVIQLRAERSGKGQGRAYRVNVTATNQYGSATASMYVLVPHDMGSDS